MEFFQAVNGVEHQKTVTLKNHDNEKVGSQKLLKKFITNCKKKRLEDAKTLEIKVACIDRVHKPILDYLMPKKYGTIQEQTTLRLKLFTEKTPYGQKRNAVEQFLPISVHSDKTTTKRSTFQQKNSKFNHFAAKSLLEPNCKRFSKSAIRENFSRKVNSQMIKTHASYPCHYFYQHS